MALGNEDADLVGVVNLVGKQRGHELDRVVRLQIGGPVGNVTVTGGVGFVEAVAGEHRDLVEDLVGEFLADVVGGLRALDEFRALLLHLHRVLLAHRAAQKVGTAERVTGEHLGGVLDLFLIDHDAERVAADFLQQRMLVHRAGAAFFHVQHLVDELHGSRAINGEKVDDVVDLLDGILAAGLDHAAGFQLEHTHRLAAVEELEGFPVLQRNVLDREVRRVLADVLHRFLDDGEVLQPEEVHLQKADIGDGLHVVLGDDFPFVSTC